MTEIPQLNISWSKLRTSEECYQKAFISSKAKSPAQDIRNFFPGTVCDRVMRDWLAGDRPCNAMPGMVEEYIQKSLDEAKESGDGVVRWRNKDDRAEVIVFCKELVTKLEPILDEYVTPYNYYSAERFKTPITIPYLDGTPTEINLIGEFDILVHADKYNVWDLKATADPNYWKKTVGQLVFYDLCVISMFGETTGEVGLIQPMCPEQTMRFSVTKEERRQMISRIITLAEAQWRGENSPKEGTEGCSYCSVNHACSRYTAVEKNGRHYVPLIKRTS